MANSSTITAQTFYKGNRTAQALYRKNKALIVALLLIVFLFGLGGVTVPNFLSFPQVLLTIKLASFIALFGLCQMVVIAAGGDGLDLSVGYAATLTAVLTTRFMDGKNETLIIAVAIAIGLGSPSGCSTVFLPPTSSCLPSW